MVFLSVTLQPIFIPSLNLNVAIDFKKRKDPKYQSQSRVSI